MKRLLIIVGAAVLLVACGGGTSPSEWATATAKARPTPNAKATAMAQANTNADIMDNAMVGICKIIPELPKCFSPEESVALRPSFVLKGYARIIGDVELGARAEALYEQTKAAWEAAHVVPPQPIIVRPAPQFPPSPDTFELDRLKRKVNELCREVGEAVC
jgi:hypothetical protein